MSALGLPYINAKKHHNDSLPSVRESDSGSSSTNSGNTPTIFFDKPTPTGDAQIADGVSKTKQFGTTALVGEVKNNSPDTIQFAKVTATYYDDQNKTLGTDFTYTDPMNIPAGSSAPFSLLNQGGEVNQAHLIKLHLDFQQ
jgi:hypothetical protein